MIQKKIKNMLEKKFGVKNVKLYNTNKYHKMHIEPRYHFTIIVVSDNFINQNLLTRHRYIYKIFKCR